MMPSPQTDLPPLLRLPPEIRIQIYDHFDLAHNGAISIFDASIASPLIGRVCKLMREEVMESFYARNRFMISNALGLSDILNKITIENLSRVTRLRLNYHERGSTENEYLCKDRTVYTRVFVDIDLLDADPWFRVTGSPLDNLAQKPANPSIVLRNKRHHEIFAGSDASVPSDSAPGQARFLLLTKLMAKVLDVVADNWGNDPISLDGRLLEFTVETWLRATHILMCSEGEPLECERCVCVLRWLRASEGRGKVSDGKRRDAHLRASMKVE